jgi:5-methyltetrahydropteroyltriglutamate--homocysteine methyltransferase
MIPEVEAIRGNLKEITEKTGVPEINLKICVTGPYTLSTLFSSRTPELIRDLGKALKELTANSLFKSRGGRTTLLTIDEPVFGFVDDPLLDQGYPGREVLREAWSCIAHAASVEGLETMIHLHSTRDNLMWEVDDLDIIGSHVGDPLYTPSSRKQLAATGKRLSVSVAETKFDDLISKATGTPSELGETWTKINRGAVNPESFLEDGDVISSRLYKCIEMFGEENIPYAGPECGLGGFPTYECAVKYLSRISSAIKKSTSL